MNKKQAEQAIIDTFENSFDKDQFLFFIRNLLNRFEEAPFVYKGNYIPDAYKDYIKTLERVGKYNHGQHTIDILIITLKKETSLERARTMQRNFVAWYLNGSRGGSMKDAALVAYVSPKEEDWRFSLVRMDYKFEQTESGKVKVREEFTPARRWSFLVGANEKSHTAQSRLVNILANDEQAPTLKELEEAFNIETVTKEFFLKYRELFLRSKEALDVVVKNVPKVKADFEAKGVDSVNFAKKLLGQIVFLYFLQKKGWFGVNRDEDWGKGSKHFLRELFDKKHCQYDNFFNDILEPLFYEALRIDRSYSDDYYSRFDCKIPFLNGGLFDPIGNYDWVQADIHLPDTFFSNNNKTREGDMGDGILDIFDRYNFTVKEDEPLEKEVAIDPELLGKAYEKFNAIRPENFDEFTKALKSGKKGEENKFNKKFGVYYTPREIVHYMCQQSLINYLYTQAMQANLSFTIQKQDLEDLIEVGEMITEHEATALIKQERIKNGIQKSSEYTALLPESIRNNAATIDQWLADIKVCDPAVGSGAFPVGMMNEIVRARNVLSVFLNGRERKDYEFKRRCIEHSLYGVDIDPGAVEIAKLRLWLSLIVDEEDIKDIKPLPNLDYRIMQGNSLISEFMGINFDVEPRKEDLLFQDETYELIEKFQQKKDEFLNESNVTKKNKLKEQVENLLIKIFETKLKTQRAEYFKSLKKIESESSVLPKEAQRQEFIRHEKEKIYKKFNFNLEAAENQLKDFSSGRKIKPFFLWNLYFSEVFHEKGGFDVVIANPPYIKEYVNKNAFEGLRKSPYYMGKMDIWYFFACKGINLLKNKGILTFIAQNNWITSYGAKKMRNKVLSDCKILLLLDFGDYKVFENVGIQTMVMVFQKEQNLARYDFDFRRLHCSNSVCYCDILALLSKRENKHVEYLTPEIDRDFMVDNPLSFNNEKYEKIFHKMEKKTNLRLQAEDITNGIHHHHDRVNRSRKIVLGEDYKIGQGIFVLSDEEKSLIPFTENELEIIKPEYTTKELFKYYANQRNQHWVIYTDSSFKNPKKMKKYPNIKKHLDKFQKVITSDNKPYGLHRARDEKFFTGEKIISVRKCVEPTFTYTNFDCYVSATFYVIKSNKINMKFLTAILNSRLIEFWLRHKGKMQGNNYQIDKEPLLSIPIVKPEENIQAPIINLIDKILSKKYSDKNIRDEKKQIDQMVYELYGLTEEEIRIVEGCEK